MTEAAVRLCDRCNGEPRPCESFALDHIFARIAKRIGPLGVVTTASHCIGVHRGAELGGADDIALAWLLFAATCKQGRFAVRPAGAPRIPANDFSRRTP